MAEVILCWISLFIVQKSANICSCDKKQCSKVGVEFFIGSLTFLSLLHEQKSSCFFIPGIGMMYNQLQLPLSNDNQVWIQVR